MKKELFFLSLIVLFGSCAKVEDFPSDKMAGVQQDKATYFVTEGQAIKNVTDFLSGFGSETRISDELPTIESISAYTCGDSPSADTRSVSQPDKIAFYAVNFADNRGFALAAADNRHVPVYAYVPNGHYEIGDVTNSGFDLFVETIVQKVDNDHDSTLFAQNTISSVNAIVAPKLTTQWGSGSPLNAYAQGTNSTSMAVALAQIAGYFKSPTSYVAYDSNTTRTINWDAIMSETATYNGLLILPTANTDSLAHFMRSVEGVCTVENLYNSSLCVSRVALWGGYNSSELLGFSYTTNDLHMLQTLLNQGRLLYFRGAANTGSYTSGYAWVIDGCNADYFHCNWGIYGQYNGYFFANGFSPVSGENPYQYSRAYCPMFHISSY